MFTLLLVEDNDGDEALAHRALKKSGISLKTDVARDGQEAIEYLSDPDRCCPDLVILDLKLPRIHGLEVLRHIRANESTRRVPVVVLTSSNEQSDVIGCFDCGANSFVRKALDYHEYVASVGKIVDYWLCVNEPCELPLWRQRV